MTLKLNYEKHPLNAMHWMELSVKFYISFDKHQIYRQLIFSLKKLCKRKVNYCKNYASKQQLNAFKEEVKQ
jgi:hypothetical protein